MALAGHGGRELSPMKRVVVAAAAVVCLALAEMPPALSSLIEAERAFAKMSVDKNTRDAFLQNLADESLLFTPGPTPGKMYYRNRPQMPQQLRWAPEFADVSAAGDLGYTSGPWEISKTASEPATGFGHFNSIWRIQKDGSWKVEVDLGIQHEKPAVAVADVKTVETAKDNAPAPKDIKTLKEWQDELLEVDRALAKTAEDPAVGVEKAFASAAAESIRLFRTDNLPAIGKAAALKLVTSSGTGPWQPTLARMSKSGDLGYSSGAIRMKKAGVPADAPGPPSFYVRIWRRDKAGVWKIVLDVTT
jgi:ketosteroid isomerase-like protein